MASIKVVMTVSSKACRLLGAEPFFGLTLDYCQLDHLSKLKVDADYNIKIPIAVIYCFYLPRYLDQLCVHQLMIFGTYNDKQIKLQYYFLLDKH